MGKKEQQEEEIVVNLDIAVDADETIALTSQDLQHKIDPLRSGFMWYLPPLASTKKHTTGGHEWTITGNDMQVLTTTVPAGEQVVTEPGSFMFKSPNIGTDVELLCTQKGCLNRCCGGETCVKVLLKNDSSQGGYVGITPNFPAKIIPIQFGTHVPANSNLIAKPGAYMSEIGSIDVGCDCDSNCLTCCCGGLGMCRQKISGGSDSIAFLAAGGTLVYRHLQPNETVTIDTNSIVAFEESVKLGITSNGRCGMCCFGGEGCFSTTLTGPGKIFMQSMSFSKFSNAVQQQVMEDRQNGDNVVGCLLSALI